MTDTPGPITVNAPTKPSKPTTHSTSSSTSSTVVTLPRSLNLYLTNRLTILAQATFHLGTSRSSAPLHRVTTHQGFSGTPDVVLRSGPSSKSPILATAEFETPLSEQILLTLPLSAHDAVRINMTSTARPPKHWGRRDWWFAVPSAGGEQGEEAKFVWRHSDGEDEERKGYRSGWNLMRRTRWEGGEETAVAFWAYPALTMTKKMAFRFVEEDGGAGGEMWATAAVVSALGIWEIERRRVAGGSAAAA
ncbi:hypothetical protein CONLIGDRAFT_643221 [Coniochaeta ligniaria NRRL 30616]|uniref:Uncharacterized protein n=1 Tax=Coniochaeta ligniaria NRRL 30616 TaxID=1408157 RepID=A0A1J7IU63_9PEZI|nr:hypothetical protein CONLIGDRAFT_643221 [Coniochaeta ligniaria NRRL 30616]